MPQCRQWSRRLPIHVAYRQCVLTAHRVEVLDREEVEVHEAVHAVGQAALLVLVELVAVDAAGDALCPADLGELVGLCINANAWSVNVSFVIQRSQRGWDVRDWICERCCWPLRNWRSSALSWSLSLSRSTLSRAEVILAVGWMRESWMAQWVAAVEVGDE